MACCETPIQFPAGTCVPLVKLNSLSTFRLVDTVVKENILSDRGVHISDFAY